MAREGLGTPDQERLMLAVSLASAAAVLAAVGAFSFVLQSRLWHDHHGAALAVEAAAGGLAGTVTFFVARWALGRPRTRWWSAAGVLVAIVAVTAASPSSASYLFPEPMDRYHRELGGPGRCLNLTAYASEDGHPKASQVTYSNKAPGHMTVVPLDRSVAPLELDHAVRGGTEHLTAADAATAEILRSHGC